MELSKRRICEIAYRQSRLISQIQQVPECVVNLIQWRSLHHPIETKFVNVIICPISTLVFREEIHTTAKPLVTCKYFFARRYLLFRSVNAIFQERTTVTTTVKGGLWEKGRICLLSATLCRVRIKSMTIWGWVLWLSLSVLLNCKGKGPRD